MSSDEQAHETVPEQAAAGSRLRAWAGAQAAPRESDAARAWAQVSGQRPESMTKRSLVAVSHAIERALLAPASVEPDRSDRLGGDATTGPGSTVVIALFQRMEYFDRERAVYERLADTGARVVVGFCDGPTHDLPAGVEAVALDPAEALVDEWSVVALSAQAGAFLVATDQHRFDPASPSLEAGRVFRCRWGFSRVQAAVELARLRLILGARLHPDTTAIVDRLLGAAMPAGADPAGSAGTAQEVWASTAAFHLPDRLQTARTGSARLRAQLVDAHAAAAARHQVGTDPQSGLTTPEFLHRWSDTTGTTVLPVGLGLFDLPAVAEAAIGDTRAAYHAARRVAAALTEPLGPVDAAIRLSEREFLIVVPGASELHLARVCDDILDQLTLASDGYPHVRLAGTLATTVTRQRPLPLAELNQARGHLDPGLDPGPRHCGTTAAGDQIVICTTREVPLPPPGDLAPASSAPTAAVDPALQTPRGAAAPSSEPSPGSSPARFLSDRRPTPSPTATAAHTAHTTDTTRPRPASHQRTDPAGDDHDAAGSGSNGHVSVERPRDAVETWEDNSLDGYRDEAVDDIPDGPAVNQVRHLFGRS